MLRSLSRLFVVFTLCLQMVSPSMVAAASQSGLDVSGFICVTPGTTMSETQARMAERLASALRGEQDNPDAHDKTCSLCVLVSAALVPALVLPVIGIFPPPEPKALRFEVGFVSTVRGPPVGATGPPAYRLT